MNRKALLMLMNGIRNVVHNGTKLFPFLVYSLIKESRVIAIVGDKLLTVYIMEDYYNSILYFLFLEKIDLARYNAT